MLEFNSNDGVVGFTRAQFWKIVFWEALEKMSSELKGGQIPFLGEKMKYHVNKRE